jgi:hypothetical protein
VNSGVDDAEHWSDLLERELAEMLQMGISNREFIF